jgi:hypothetical protein
VRAPRPDLTTASWRRSSYSSADGGECVEVSDDFSGVVPVQDSKNPGPALAIPTPAWQAFVDYVRL